MKRLKGDDLGSGLYESQAGDMTAQHRTSASHYLLLFDTLQVPQAANTTRIHVLTNISKVPV